MRDWLEGLIKFKSVIVLLYFILVNFINFFVCWSWSVYWVFFNWISFWFFWIKLFCLIKIFLIRVLNVDEILVFFVDGWMVLEVGIELLILVVVL